MIWDELLDCPRPAQGSEVEVKVKTGFPANRAPSPVDSAGEAWHADPRPL